ncbi:hypothetical protein NpPPO83_00008961 [Neofusicoccum parvum]|uniref:Uncharacterized protein n=1 Tax=Neofusicoccum parvum TaxID=310453 RepID=A0ACB5SK49_9PEZI|nr:hypothetical protein NpPPO83_00008961 [Neofusicoccum parvum]
MLFNKSALVALITFIGPSIVAASTFNCTEGVERCLSDHADDPNAPTYCPHEFESCFACNTQEDDCHTRGDTDCVYQAQLCYFEAIDLGTIHAWYACDGAWLTCFSQATTPKEQGYCNDVMFHCKRCEQDKNLCFQAPDANGPYCTSQWSTCFKAAMLDA